MPAYFPEGDTPQPTDTIGRSLQKIVSLVASGGGGGGGGGGSSLTSPLFVTVEDSATNTSTTLATFRHRSTGTPAQNFGSRILFQLETDAGIDRDAAAIDVVWNQATDSAARSVLLFRTKTDATNNLFGDAQIKVCRIGFPHYNTAQLPVALLVSTSDATQNALAIGGSSSSFNAVTQIALWTAPDTTTSPGTRRLTIQSDGQMLFNINPPQTIGYYYFNTPSTATQLSATYFQSLYTDITAETFANRITVTFSPTTNNTQTLYDLLNDCIITGAVTKSIVCNQISRFTVSGTGSITSLFNYLAFYASTVGSAVTHYHAFRVPTPLNTSGGTITNAYAYSCQEMKGTGVTNAWSLYSEGANTNMYHAGQVRIGSTSDLGVGILQVTGDLAFNGARTIRTTTGNLTLQTDAGNGDVIIDPHGTGRLRFGTFVATSVSLAGYIEIKDSAGTTRRLAVVT
jgi:hypothetical protein